MSHERHDFEIGEEASITKTFSDEDLRHYALLTGDLNPIHLDEEYAQQSRFGHRIVYGMLVAGLLSAVLGTQLPGPGSIYMGQQLKFTAPVYIGEIVTAQVKIIEWDAIKGRITLQTDVVKQDGTVAITGEARLVMSEYLKPE